MNVSERFSLKGILLAKLQHLRDDQQDLTLFLSLLFMYLFQNFLLVFPGYGNRFSFNFNAIPFNGIYFIHCHGKRTMNPHEFFGR